MNSKEFKAIMDENGWKNSEAVKVYLNFAAHYKRLYTALKKNYQDREADTEFLHKQLYKLDEKRIEAVWLALDTAHEEQLQGWRYIEDGEEYINMLMVKYDCDLSKCNQLEKLKVAYTQNVDEQRRKQIKADWRKVWEQCKFREM